ncbi:MAG: sensor histidine kinase, partial [Caldilineae bacterium]
EAVARRAESLLWPVPQVEALEDLAQTAASLGRDHVRILDAQHRVIVESLPDSEANAYVWIVPPSGTGLNSPIIGSFIFSLPTLRAMARDQASSGPGVIFGQFLEQFPPDSEWVLVRRIEEPWGNRLVFEATESRPTSVTTPVVSALAEAPETIQMRLVQLLPGDHASSQPDTNTDFQSITLPIGDAAAPLGYVQLTRQLTLSHRALATTQRSLVLASLAAMLLSAVVGFVVSGTLTAPLQDLAAATRMMSRGDLSVRAQVRGGSELEQVARQFNAMAETLQNNFAQLRQERDALRRFVADASHELRTPITALKNFNELLQGPAAADEAARAEFLAESQQQIERLEWITRNLLNLSRLDAGLATLDLETHDVGEILEAAVAPFRPQADEKGIELSLLVPDTGSEVYCDRPRIELALSNILDNALRHTPAGGQIEVGAELQAGVARLWVHDSGPGIPPEHRPHIFKRFYHIDNEGTGLGLAIVHSIVNAHEGRVYLDENVEQGCRFVIELKLDKSHADPLHL